MLPHGDAQRFPKGGGVVGMGVQAVDGWVRGLYAVLGMWGGWCIQDCFAALARATRTPVGGWDGNWR